MDDKIVSIADYRPHQSSYCACVACGKEFVSAFPAGVTVLECPACGEMAGEVVRYDDADFFKRYIGASKTQADQFRRGYVLLNAKRMNELKPCPFCGGDVLGIGGDASLYVECYTCRAEGPFGATVADARTLWNERATDDR